MEREKDGGTGGRDDWGGKWAVGRQCRPGLKETGGKRKERTDHMGERM